MRTIFLLSACCVALLAGCHRSGEGARLADQARLLWDNGNYQDSARNFATLAQFYPETPLAEEALFLAASLNHHFLGNLEEAARFYQSLTVSFPKGRYFFEAKENLAAVYEASKESRHRALQIYQQLLVSPELSERAEFFRFKIGQLNLRLGKMDQARMEFRDLLLKHPQSPYRAETFYLIGYSYYLEKRNDLALSVFRETQREFTGSPIAVRAEFFVADTLEEEGKMRQALKAFRALKTRYPTPQIVDQRIKALEARIRRGVR